MILVRIMDGLGNQMFQYAMARRLALHHDVPLKLDLSAFKTEKLRKYALNHFHIQAEIAAPEEIKRYYRRTFLQAPGIIMDYITASKRGLRRPFFHEDEIRLRFDPRVLSLSDDVYVWGHWQCEKYFEDIATELKRDFTLRTPPDEANARMMQEIEGKNAVCLHIRRGDYVANPQNHKDLGACSLDYYARAVEHIGYYVENPHFYVFSDDPVWSRENLKLRYPATFVDHNGPEKDYEDLRLMKSCKHFIIANSSFSWWGAWLSVNPDKIIIAPKKWFHNQTRVPENIIPDRWLRL